VRGKGKEKQEESGGTSGRRQEGEGDRRLSSAFIDVDGIPLEVVETERRLAAAAADALMVKIILKHREMSKMME
jgi:hypothetical protein